MKSKKIFLILSTKYNSRKQHYIRTFPNLSHNSILLESWPSFLRQSSSSECYIYVSLFVKSSSVSGLTGQFSASFLKENNEIVGRSWEYSDKPVEKNLQ